jgi:hypothetical protein
LIRLRRIHTAVTTATRIVTPSAAVWILSSRINQVDTRVALVDVRMEQIDIRIKHIEAGVEGLALGLGRIENHLDTLPRTASSTTTVVPIFSQLLVFSTPNDFKAAGEALRDNRYVQRSVPVGQSLDRWTEMITVTGEKDAATLPGVSPQKVAENMAGAWKQGCPESFAAASFGPVKVERYDGFATVIACGAADVDKARSQTLMVVAIRGERDVYTLQWTERGPPSKTPPAIDARRWQDRLARIAPVRLCTIEPGEAPPFPRCLGKR